MSESSLCGSVRARRNAQQSKERACLSFCSEKANEKTVYAESAVVSTTLLQAKRDH
jgi:hypothetical protein